jgi:hypothetical protein
MSKTLGYEVVNLLPGDLTTMRTQTHAFQEHLLH